MIVLSPETVPTPDAVTAPPPSHADPAAGPGTPVTAPRSRAALNLPGLCPLCGQDAVRKLRHTDGETIEAYRCPTDGEVTYRSGLYTGIGLDGQAADIARLVAMRPGAAAHFVGMGSTPISAGA